MPAAPSRHRGRRRPLALLVAPALVWSCTPSTVVIPLASTSSGTEATSSPTPSETPSETPTTDPSPDETGASETSTSSADTDATAGGCAAGPADDWWDEAWRRRRPIEIDTSAATEPVTNFPVLVRIPTAELGPSGPERAGHDLRFRSADGSLGLSYELDDVDDDGVLFVWLKVPQIAPDTGPLSVWMYYDNAAAEPNSSGPEVWTDFFSVHHLGTSLDDSTQTYDGSSRWPPALCDERCDALIGVSRTFDPELLHEVVLYESESLDLGADPYDEVTRTFSISVWMRSSSFVAYPGGALIAKGNDTWRVQNLDGQVAFGLDCFLTSCVELGVVDEWNSFNMRATTDVNDGIWHYVAATFEATNLRAPMDEELVAGAVVRLYVDGVELGSEEIDEFRVGENEQPVRFGHNINTTARWGGVLDEVRLMPGVRSAAEIALDYAFVMDDDRVALGPEDVSCR